MKDCWVNWRGDFEKWQPVLFVTEIRISWPDRVMWLTVDRTLIPAKKRNVLNETCPIFRVASNGGLYYAQKVMLPNYHDLIRAELLDDVPDRAE